MDDSADDDSAYFEGEDDGEELAAALAPARPHSPRAAAPAGRPAARRVVKTSGRGIAKHAKSHGKRVVARRSGGGDKGMSAAAMRLLQARLMDKDVPADRAVEWDNDGYDV